MRGIYRGSMILVNDSVARVARSISSHYAVSGTYIELLDFVFRADAAVPLFFLSRWRDSLICFRSPLGASPALFTQMYIFE